MKKTAANIALHDISRHLDEERLRCVDRYGQDGVDVWYVSSDTLRDLTPGHMNQELGLLSVNKGKHNMSRQKRPSVSNLPKE